MSNAGTKFVSVALLTKRLGLTVRDIVFPCIDGYAPIYFKVPAMDLKNEYRQIDPASADVINDLYTQYNHEQQFDLSTRHLILSDSDKRIIFRHEIKEAEKNGEEFDVNEHAFAFCTERDPSEALYLREDDVAKFRPIKESQEDSRPTEVAKLPLAKVPQGTKWEDIEIKLTSDGKHLEFNIPTLGAKSFHFAQLNFRDARRGNKVVAGAYWDTLLEFFSNKKSREHSDRLEDHVKNINRRLEAALSILDRQPIHLPKNETHYVAKFILKNDYLGDYPEDDAYGDEADE